MSWGEIDQVGRWRIIAAGAFGGVVASYMMNQFQGLLSKAQTELSSDSGSGSDSSGGSSGENATVKAAQSISHAVGAGDIPEEEKESAGTVVHYAFGGLVGAVYGALASQFPRVSSGYGVAYGSAVWLLGDEAAVPALGLAPSPEKSPLSTHLQALAAHCMYGFTTDLVMRGFIKKIWPVRP